MLIIFTFCEQLFQTSYENKHAAIIFNINMQQSWGLKTSKNDWKIYHFHESGINSNSRVDFGNRCAGFGDKRVDKKWNIN